MKIMNINYIYILTFLAMFSGGSLANENQNFIQTSSGSIIGHVEKKVINYDDIIK